MSTKASRNKITTWSWSWPLLSTNDWKWKKKSSSSSPSSSSSSSSSTSSSSSSSSSSSDKIEQIQNCAKKFSKNSKSAVVPGSASTLMERFENLMEFRVMLTFRLSFLMHLPPPPPSSSSSSSLSLHCTRIS